MIWRCFHNGIVQNIAEVEPAAGRIFFKRFFNQIRVPYVFMGTVAFSTFIAAITLASLFKR